MKRLVLLCTILVGACAALLADARLEIATKSYDFGNIREADGPVSHVFTFTNTGDTPLAVISAKAACGCTRPEYSKRPVQPGESATIKVTYLPAGRPGEFTRDVTIRTNAKNAKKLVLKITGVVIPAK